MEIEAPVVGSVGEGIMGDDVDCFDWAASDVDFLVCGDEVDGLEGWWCVVHF